jgi:hypothetical protein
VSESLLTSTIRRIDASDRPLSAGRVAVLAGVPLSWWRTRVSWALPEWCLIRLGMMSDYLGQQRFALETHRAYWTQVGARMWTSFADLKQTGARVFYPAGHSDVESALRPGAYDAVVLISHQISDTAFELNYRCALISALQEGLASRRTSSPLSFMYVVCCSLRWAAETRSALGEGLVFGATYEVPLAEAIPLVTLTMRCLDGKTSLAEAQRKAFEQYRSNGGGDDKQ